MEVEFNTQTEQFEVITGDFFSCTAPELTYEQVEEIKTAIMTEQTYHYDDISGLTYYFSYEEFTMGNKSWDIVKMTIVNGELKITAKFMQDRFFEALDNLAEYYDSMEDDDDDDYPEDDIEEDFQEDDEDDEMSDNEDKN